MSRPTRSRAAFALGRAVVRAFAALAFAALLGFASPARAAAGLVGTYFSNATLTAPPTKVQVDATVAFNWGGGSPDAAIPADYFSVRWSGVLRVATSGAYTFQTTGDDGVRLYVNGALVINDWVSHAPTVNVSGAVSLTAGVDYPITLEFFENTGGAEIALAWKRPGDSAFSTVPASNGTSGLATGTAPMLEYRFEEPQWSGAAGEILDTSGNAWHGTAAGLAATKPTTTGASPAVGTTTGTCGYGVFNRANKDYVALPSTFPNLGSSGSFTVTAWIRTADASATGQRIFIDDENGGGSSSVGWGLSLGDRGSGKLNFVTRANGAEAITPAVIANNTWYFVAFGVDLPNKTKFIRVHDTGGALLASVTTTFTQSSIGVDPGIASIGGETNAAAYSENNSSFGFGGNLDEVRIYAWALTAAETATVRALANACPYTAAPTLIGEYRFEEAAWSGAAGELKDTAGAAGGPFNGSAQGSPLPTPGLANAARANDPGTCGYALLPGPQNGGGNFVIPGLPVAGGAGAQTSVAFWMYWGGTNSDIVLSWGSYDLFFTGGSFGFNTANSDVYGIASSGLANSWHHVVAVFTNGSVISNRLYIDGVQQALSQRVGSPALASASVALPLRVGGFAPGSTFRFSGRIDELRVYSGGARAADALADFNRSAACAAYTPPAGGFNAFETATPAGSVDGVIHTKVAGSPFALDIVALNAARNATVGTFYGNVKVELLDASDMSGALDATSGCRASWLPVAGNVAVPKTFAGGTGRVGVNQSEANAWRNVRVRISYPASGTATSVGCSTDNFAIRPAGFSAPLVSDADWQTAGTARTLGNVAASGGAVHKAGQPFRLRSAAVNAATTPATTTNYTGTPAAQLSGCAGTGCVGTPGTLVVALAAAAGVIDSPAATYSEAGAFTLQLADAGFAAVDAADGSTAAERTISSPPVAVGRFVPDHFDVTALVTPVLRTFGSAGCSARSFTYVGQPFGWATPPQATVLARNADGATTLNYSGALWKLSVASVAQSWVPLASASPGLDTSGAFAPTLASGGNGTGVIAASNADAYLVPRPAAAPLAPFNAAFSLAWSVADASEAGVSGNGSIATAVPLSMPNIAFDAGNAFRYGVAKLGSAYGSELVDLTAPVELQYWDGARFATNSGDNCTTLAAANVTLGNYQRNLAACQTAQTAATLRFAAGRAMLRLAKPGNGHAGSVDATLNLGSAATGQTCTAVNGAPATTAGAGLAWLQGRTATVGTFDQNPTARLGFGQNKSPLVHLRETF